MSVISGEIKRKVLCEILNIWHIEWSTWYNHDTKITKVSEDHTRDTDNFFQVVFQYEFSTYMDYLYIISENSLTNILFSIRNFITIIQNNKVDQHWRNWSILRLFKKLDMKNKSISKY